MSQICQKVFCRVFSTETRFGVDGTHKHASLLLPLASLALRQFFREAGGEHRVSQGPTNGPNWDLLKGRTAFATKNMAAHFQRWLKETERPKNNQKQMLSKSRTSFVLLIPTAVRIDSCLLLSNLPLVLDSILGSPSRLIAGGVIGQVPRLFSSGCGGGWVGREGMFDGNSSNTLLIVQPLILSAPIREPRGRQKELGTNTRPN